MKIFLFSCFFLLTSIVNRAQNPSACSTNTCTTGSAIDTCPPNSTNITYLRNAFLYVSGSNCTDGLCPGSVWRFPSFTIAGGQTINATVTIDAISNAVLESIDDDAVTDQNNINKSSLLAPHIKSDIPLNGADRKGYVQFTVRFFRAKTGDGYSLLINLSGLNIFQYDIDGNSAGGINTGNPGSWYRETTHIKSKTTGNLQTIFDQATELTANEYADGTDQWKGGMSSVCERTGLSGCNQTAMAAKFSDLQYSVSFRLGYNYNAGGNIGQPVSQYGIKLSCFSISGGIQLPVNLYEFTAKRNGAAVQLNWATTYEQLNQGFLVQRRTGNEEFSDIAFLPSQAPGGNSQIKLYYRYADQYSFKGVSQYRIIQTDLQNKIRVSEVRSVAGELQQNSVVIFPNPATDGNMTIVFEDSRGLRDAVLNDITGRRIKQWNNLTGNTISIENLLPGIYSIRITDKETGEVQTGRFVVNK
jgi:hypothetical protein